MHIAQCYQFIIIRQTTFKTIYRVKISYVKNKVSAWDVILLCEFKNINKNNTIDKFGFGYSVSVQYVLTLIIVKNKPCTVFFFIRVTKIFNFGWFLKPHCAKNNWR